MMIFESGARRLRRATPSTIACVQQPVGRNRDDRRTATLVAGQHDVDQIGPDERLAAAERRPVERRAERLEDAAVLGQRQIVDALLPDVARLAAGVAAVGDAERQVQGTRCEPTGASRDVVNDGLSQRTQHGAVRQPNR